MKVLLAWAQQPTTVAGMSAVIGTISALILHQIGWGQAVPVLIGAAVSIALPDNGGAGSEARAFVATLITQFQQTKEGK